MDFFINKEFSVTGPFKEIVPIAMLKNLNRVIVDYREYEFGACTDWEQIRSKYADSDFKGAYIIYVSQSKESLAKSYEYIKTKINPKTFENAQMLTEKSGGTRTSIYVVVK